MFGEYKRVFDKKTGWVILILLAVNLSLYLYGQFTESRAGTVGDFLLYCRQYKEIVAANQEDAADLKAYAAVHNIEEEQYSDFTARIYSEVARQWEYIEGYEDLFEAMDRQVEQLGAVSIFADPDSVSNRNMVKTQQELSPLREQTPTVGYDWVTQSITEYEELQWLSLFFILYLLYRLVGEQNRGTWKVLHSTAKGRWQLAAWRMGCLAGGIALYHFLASVTLYGCALLLYGRADELVRAVQSMESLTFFPYAINVGQYWLWCLGVRILGGIALGCVLWLVLQLVRTWLAGLGIFAGLLWLEYLAFHNLYDGANLLLFKYANLYHFLFPVNSLSRYYNVRVGEALLSNQTIFALGAAAGIAVSAAALFLLAQRQKDNYIAFDAGFFQNIFKRFRAKRHIIFPVWVTELKKILGGKLGVAALLLMILLFYVRTRPQTIYYSRADNILNQFYHEYVAKDLQDGIEYINSLETEMETEMEQYLEAQAAQEAGTMGSEEFTAAAARWESFYGLREALGSMEERRSYLEELKRETGIEGSFVNPRGYEYMIGPSGEETQHLTAFILILAIALLCANVFAGERSSGFRHLAFSMERGRQYWFWQKMIAITGLIVLLWGGVFALDYLAARNTYGLEGLGAPVQSLAFLGSVRISCSLGGYILLVYLAKLLLLLSFGLWMVFLSVYASAFTSLLAAGAVLILPELLHRLGFSFAENFSLVHGLCVTSPASLRATFYLTVLCLGTGGILCVLANKKWCTTEGGRRWS